MWNTPTVQATSRTIVHNTVQIYYPVKKKIV